MSASADVSFRRRLTKTAWGALIIGFAGSVVVGLVWSLVTQVSVAQGIAWTLVVVGAILLIVGIFSIGATDEGGGVHPGARTGMMAGEQQREKGPSTLRTGLWLMGGAVVYFVVAALVLQI